MYICNLMLMHALAIMSCASEPTHCCRAKRAINLELQWTWTTPIPSLTTDNTSDISYIEIYNISQSKGNFSILKIRSISIVLQCPWQSLSCNHARHHLTPTSSIFSFLHVQPEIPSGHETTRHQWIMASRSNATMKFYCFYLQLNIHIWDWQSYSCNGHWTN